ncbi:hypothetical protein OG252_04775 [Streptomyces sp. NBC_01352]|uniref:hypothetical protein n=1 Tax=unclassified Streptomyces TaxID=2593676 RepID=UPI0022503DA3|nr:MULTISPECIES: hypothetical protein [unclassified Streptomyces]MCX4706139.1 hypothetical protein [Streptomyces sp. NBC_01373]
MSTGIDSWKDLDSIDTLHPFPGSEYVLVVVALLTWIGFHVWQVKAENDEFEEALTTMDAEAPEDADAGSAEAAEPVAAAAEDEKEMAAAAEKS